MSRLVWRHQYDGVRDELEGDRTVIWCEDASLTNQQFVQDADINVLVKRFGLDKVAVPSLALDARYYGDVSEVPDLRTLLDIARDAENKFMELPADLRARFDNSPAQLWAFVNDPINEEASVKLGLLHRPPPEPAVPAPVESGKGVPEGNKEAGS